MNKVSYALLRLDYFIYQTLTGQCMHILTGEVASNAYPALSFEGTAGCEEVKNQNKIKYRKTIQAINNINKAIAENIHTLFISPFSSASTSVCESK